MGKKTEPASVVYSPLDVANLGEDYLKYKQDHKDFGVPFPITKGKLNGVYPLFPGEVFSLIARPGHMKTGLMMFWARQRAHALREMKSNRVVIYATWEQSIEELHSFYVAAEQQISVTKMAKGDLTESDWQKAKSATASRISEPLWFIGHSMMRKTGRQPITIETLNQAVDVVDERGFEIDSVFADYLQRMPPVEKQNGIMEVCYANMDGLKNFALGRGLPVVVGVQASRDVEALKVQIPESHHAQWTSNIEQSSDRVASLVRPIKYKREGEAFGGIVVQGRTQLLITMLKQKLGDGNFVEVANFNPIYNRLNDAEQELEEQQ